MSTMIPIPYPVPTPPEDDGHCCKCQKKEDEVSLSLGEFIVCSYILALIVLFFIGLMSGYSNGNRGHRYFDRPGKIIFFTYDFGVYAGKFLDTPFK